MTRIEAIPRQDNGVLTGIGHFLLSAMLFFSLLPYVGFGPIAAPSQVQPWAAAFGWLFILHRSVTNGIRITPIHITLGIFSIWFMIYVSRSVDFDISIYFRRSAVFFISMGILLAAQYITPNILMRQLKIVLPVWLAFGLLRYASPDLYFSIVRVLVPTVVESSARGSSSLAPEATDMGFTMSFALLLVLMARFSLRSQGQPSARWPILVAISTMALSTSGAGFFSFVLILATVAIFGAKKIKQGRILASAFIAPLLIFGLYFVLLSLPDTGIRGIDLLSLSAQNPSELINSTFSYRLVHNTVGLVAIYDSNLLGFGAGSFLVEAPRIEYDYNITILFGLTGYYAQNVPLTLSQSPISFLAVIFLEYGIVGVFYVMYLFSNAAKSNAPYTLTAVSMLILTWSQSFPAAWPPFWVLLGIMLGSKFGTFPTRTDAPGGLIPKFVAHGGRLQ